MTPDDNNKKLEAFVHQTLRSVPARRAPSALEQRVMAEIARRAALPWWQKSFAHWPAPARLSFLGVSAAFASLVVMAGIEVMRFGSGIGIGNGLNRLAALKTNLLAAGNVITGLFPAHTTYWVVGIGAVVALTYTLILAAGATAYRLLWKTR